MAAVICPLVTWASRICVSAKPNRPFSRPFSFAHICTPTQTWTREKVRDTWSKADAWPDRASPFGVFPADSSEDEQLPTSTPLETWDEVRLLHAASAERGKLE